MKGELMIDICFVIMPIGDSGADKTKAEMWTEIYEDIIVPSVAKSGVNLQCVRADTINESGNIVRDVVSYLCDSRLVIADLTDRNPNVFYELGVRHALGRPTILIAQRVNDIPFDLRSYRAVIYSVSPRAIAKFSSDLQATIRNVLTDETKPTSPVADFLTPSRVAAVFADVQRESSRARTPADLTLAKIEARIYDMQKGQEKLTREVTRLTEERKSVIESLHGIEVLRKHIQQPSKHSASAPNVSISGEWRGTSGKLRINQSGNRITGDYDWKGRNWVGHIVGALDGEVVRFDWWWDVTPEKGNGFFIVDAASATLQGGWYMDYEEVNIEEAIKGGFDKALHPWSFMRQGQTKASIVRSARSGSHATEA